MTLNDDEESKRNRYGILKSNFIPLRHDPSLLFINCSSLPQPFILLLFRPLSNTKLKLWSCDQVSCRLCRLAYSSTALFSLFPFSNLSVTLRFSNQTERKRPSGDGVASHEGINHRSYGQHHGYASNHVGTDPSFKTHLMVSCALTVLVTSAKFHSSSAIEGLVPTPCR